MILIFIREPANRATYSFRLLLHDILGIDCEVTSDTAYFLAFQGPKFSYGHQPLANELFIHANAMHEYFRKKEKIFICDK